MTSTWLEGVGRSIEQSLDSLAAAVRDCPTALWDAPMWPVEAPGADHPFLGADWQPITDPAERGKLAESWVKRRSTPWSVAWHALEGFDYDLNGEFGPWMPPPPFAGHPQWRDLPGLPNPWSPAEIMDYIEYCRVQAGKFLANLSEEDAARSLPPAHRYRGQPHAWIIASLPAHTTEHATQIRQFITAHEDA